MHAQTQVPIAGTINNGAYALAMPRPVWCGPTKGRDFTSTLIASMLIGITDLAFLSSSDRFDHWFLIPIGFCGVLVGIDAIEWLRGRLGLYDPIGILGIFGIHFFFLAPLLHVKWDFWIGGVSPPPDWRDWLGYMGILNAVGLVFYRICRQTFNVGVSSRRVFWDIDKAKLRIFLPVCIVVSAAAQSWFYSQVGGIVGYMQARMDPSQQSAFEGMGWFFMISESAPILVAFFVVVHLQQRKISWSRAATVLLVLFTLQMYFGGLRGSRSETVLLLFWVVGCIHFLVRPVPRKLIYCGAVFILAFMYLYGFYKAMGSDAIEVFSGSEHREQMAQKTGRTLETLVLGDLDRADLQSFILYRLIKDGSDFSYGWGRTYLAALSLWVPHWILPNRLENKGKEGTEVQTGSGTYYPGSVSSKVYGLAGESMLNFGPLSVPFAFAIFGLFIGWFRSVVSRLLPGDARFLLVPFGVYCCLSVLGSDLDNLTFGLAKNGFMPLLVVIVCSIRRKQFMLHGRPTGPSIAAAKNTAIARRSKNSSSESELEPSCQLVKDKEQVYKAGAGLVARGLATAAPIASRGELPPVDIASVPQGAASPIGTEAASEKPPEQRVRAMLKNHPRPENRRPLLRPLGGMLLCIALLVGLLASDRFMPRNSLSKASHTQGVTTQRPTAIVEPAEAAVLAESSNTNLPSGVTSASSSVVSGAVKSQDTTTVTGIHYSSNGDSTIVMIDLDNEVKYEGRRLTSPERIYFDLGNTRLASDLLGRNFTLGTLAVSKMRVAQRQPGVTRIAFETNGFCQYATRFISGPPRLLIELRAHPHSRH